LEDFAEEFPLVLDPLLNQLNSNSREAVHLAIEAFSTFSRADPGVVKTMAPTITPQLLEIFKSEHSKGSIGN
jgi:hypothetical protein